MRLDGHSSLTWSVFAIGLARPAFTEAMQRGSERLPRIYIERELNALPK